MIIKRKTQIILALIVSSVFLFQNCATISRGTYLKIPVTSNPLGAKIIVNGVERGYSPLELKLNRKKNHIIRLEKQGYNPLEIRIIRKISSGLLVSSFIGNTLLAIIPASFVALGNLLGGRKANAGLTLVALAGGFTLMDSVSGKNYALSPYHLILTLKKIEGKPQPKIILIDADKFQNIKGIRIKCADSEGEEEIINLD
jgi:hypothetical protein